ncbi:hypothetical protein AP460_02978 [Actinobacillus pleuropneumoniae]|nr:hypothetical protein AP1022_02985 [Actinobacillus pleuropneumoniae]UKH38006.1 hypothetical protein D1101_10785 [Actinobacillus pleuropneumoniae serovar 8 str. 405]UKH46684.1 hypothetical protein D1095_10515 [Actinobacillus pleuropneumoniae serovar 2 str. S1536]KIE88128.1 hypothetical protein AP518_03084 [Actinobacillus pleuropneumoniae]KIE88225.1 hypothetical protein AP460_02978 [Actinobacillus pleuropneumoniae]
MDDYKFVRRFLWQLKLILLMYLIILNMTHLTRIEKWKNHVINNRRKYPKFIRAVMVLIFWDSTTIVDGVSHMTLEKFINM